MFRVARLALPTCALLGSLATFRPVSKCDAHQSTIVNFIVKTVNENQIVVFSKTRCRYCVIAKGILESMGLKYKLIELDVSVSPCCVISNVSTGY